MTEPQYACSCCGSDALEPFVLVCKNCCCRLDVTHRADRHSLDNQIARWENVISSRDKLAEMNVQLMDELMGKNKRIMELERTIEIIKEMLKQDLERE